jgi:hypothetical protein
MTKFACRCVQVERGKKEAGPNRRRRQLGPGNSRDREIYLKQQAGKIGEKTNLLTRMTVRGSGSSPRRLNFFNSCCFHADTAAISRRNSPFKGAWCIAFRDHQPAIQLGAKFVGALLAECGEELHGHVRPQGLELPGGGK